MDKWLYFHTATADSICLPVRDLVGMEIDHGSGTGLDMRVRNANTGDDCVGEYEIVLTITADTGKTVMNTIAKEIRSGKTPFVVIADDVNAVMIDSNISACGSITAIS